MFHVEVRQFPHVARAFNLSAEELEERVIGPWAGGRVFKFGEHDWEPRKVKLTVLEGREMATEELGMGRGWSAAGREAEDVTARVLAVARAAAAGARAADAGPIDPATLAGFKALVLAEVGVEPGSGGGGTGAPEATATPGASEPPVIALHEVMGLANAQHPELRVSGRLALAEQSLWELLHGGEVVLLERGADGELVMVERSQWQPALLDWAAWRELDKPRWLLRAA